MTSIASNESEFKSGRPLSIGDSFAEGIKLSKGTKWQTQKALAASSAVVALIYILFNQIPAYLIATSPSPSPVLIWVMGTGQVVLMLVTAPLIAGSILLGAQAATGGKISSRTVNHCYCQMPRLFVVYIAVNVLTAIGLVMFVLPGIYLVVAYMFAIPLASEKRLTVWAAMELSRKTVSAHWFGYLGLFTLLMVVNLIAMIPLGIGLIWTIPWSINTIGVIYRDQFGYKARDIGA